MRIQFFLAQRGSIAAQRRARGARGAIAFCVTGARCVISSRSGVRGIGRFARGFSARPLGPSGHADGDDAEAAEANLVAVAQLPPTLEANGLLVVERAVGRAEVCQDKPAALTLD